MMAFQGYSKVLAMHGLKAWPAINTEYREQAVRVLPLLEALVNDESIYRQSLLQIIDGARPLWPNLAVLLDIRAATVRRLRYISMTTIPQYWHTRPAMMLQVLDAIPLDFQPVSIADWNAFTYVVATLDVAPRVRDEIHLHLADWSVWGLPMRLGWLIQCARLGWGAAANKLRQMAVDPVRMRDIAHFFHELAYRLWQQRLPGQSPVSYSILRQQYGEQGLWRVLRLVSEWQPQRSPAPEPRLASSVWPVPVLAPVPLGELSAIFLYSGVQLKEEGEMMAHCAYSFVTQCAQGRASIVSLREGERRIATACLEQQAWREGFYFRCTQLVGLRNSEPPLAAKHAVEQLLVWLNDDASLLLRVGYRNGFLNSQVDER